jgi:CheY-like chemotaxis protein
MMSGPQDATPLTIQIEPSDVLRVLYIEDEEEYRNAISENFADRGYDVDVVSSPSEAVDKVNNKRYNLVVVDIQLSVKDIAGDEFLYKNKDVLKEAKTIALTGQRAAIKHHGVFTHIIDKGDELEFFDRIAEIFEDKKSEFAEQLTKAARDLMDGTLTLDDEYLISKEELRLLEEELLNELHNLEAKDDKVIIFQGKRYSVNDLISEIHNGSIVGRAHIRMMLNLIHGEHS